MTQAYPLQWPFGWKRSTTRSHGRFHGTSTFTYASGGMGRRAVDITVHEGRKRVCAELDRLGVSVNDFVISTNLPLRMDGFPRSDARNPNDPGVAVYFKLKGKDRVLACDRWATVAKNMAAIAAHINAIRGIERWGVGTLDQAFTGYDALPPPGARTKRHWKDVLGLNGYASKPETLDLAEVSYRRLLSERHPDKGGSHEQAAELNEAIEDARRDLA